MCGIIGCFGSSDIALAKKAARSINHRGPDQDGFYSDENVVLGNKRLSIIDLSEAGRQPAHNEDETVFVVFNGEIYNFLELRKELEKKHDFYSHSDTEVLVHAYEEWGDGFIEKLDGMFAFALWDSQNEKLLLARDKFGEKPLYYSLHNGVFWFASEIKALLAAGLPKKLNEQALGSYLAFQFVPGEETLFEGINKLSPGDKLVVTKKGFSKSKYWDLGEYRLGKIDDEKEAVEGVKKLLPSLAKTRSIADVPIGAFLSGGLDSTTIVALTKEFMPEEYHTFSVNFGDYSDSPDPHFAKIASETFGTIHHEVFVGPEDVEKNISQIAWHYDEPPGDAGALPFFMLSREARKKVKVCFSGQGSDELFGEYAQYEFAFEKGLAWRTVNALARKPLRFLSKRFLERKNPAENRNARILSFLSQKNLDGAFVYANMRAMDDVEVKKLTGTGKEAQEKVVFPPNALREKLHRMQYIDMRNTLPEKYLMIADKMSMAHSLEARNVFFSGKLADLLFSTLPRLKISDKNGKNLLKSAVAGLIPKEIISRRKRGFGVPYQNWMGGELKDFVASKIEEGGLAKKFFKPNALEQMLDVRKSLGKSGHVGTVLWTVFAAEVWYEQYFGDRARV